jgi:tetraacyldisaccharide 4'-kinase
MIIFAPIGWLYGLIMQVRNALYDRGIFQSYDLGARTISIGNITTGGTGKTPLVALIADILAENGENVCILTRGYGRKNEKERIVVCGRDTVVDDPEIAGDEPIELARKLLGKAIIIADANRVAAAKWAKEKFDITAFLLDDAFQHRQAKRGVDIVCIDAIDPFGNGSVLPGGRLREGTSGLERANLIVITRSDLIKNTDDLEVRLRKVSRRAAIFKATMSIKTIVSLEAFHAKMQSSQKALPQNGFAFSGLANNENFIESLKKIDIHPVGQSEFVDHHNYTQQQVDQIETRARNKKAEYLITTAKDAVKLKGMKLSMPCYVAEIETAIDDPDRFRELLLSI